MGIFFLFRVSSCCGFGDPCWSDPSGAEILLLLLFFFWWIGHSNDPRRKWCPILAQFCCSLECLDWCRQGIDDIPGSVYMFFFLLKDTRFNMQSRRLESMELSFLFFPATIRVFSLYFQSVFFMFLVKGNSLRLWSYRTWGLYMMPSPELIKWFRFHSVRGLGTNSRTIFWIEFDNCCVNVPRVTWFYTAGRKFHRRGGIMTSMLRRSGSNSGSKSLDHEPSSPAEEQVKVIHRWTIWFEALRFGC